MRRQYLFFAVSILYSISCELEEHEIMFVLDSYGKIPQRETVKPLCFFCVVPLFLSHLHLYAVCQMGVFFQVFFFCCYLLFYLSRVSSVTDVLITLSLGFWSNFFLVYFLSRED